MFTAIFIISLWGGGRKGGTKRQFGISINKKDFKFCFSQFRMAPNVAAKAGIPGRLNEAESKACVISKPTKRESFSQIHRNVE